VDQVGVSHGSRQPSIRLLVVPTVCYLQGWMQLPEDWIKWVMALHEIENLMAMKETADKSRMFQNLLNGQALSYFEHHLMRRLETEDSENPDNELIEQVLRDISLEYTPKCAIQVQRCYMREPLGLYMGLGLNTSIQQFVESQPLNDLNRYLLYFPEDNPKQIDQDEIIEILDQSKPRLGILNNMKQWSMPILTFLICLMKNRFLLQAFGELGEDQAQQRSQSFLTTS
jgi:hypothetical protein